MFGSRSTGFTFGSPRVPLFSNHNHESLFMPSEETSEPVACESCSEEQPSTETQQLKEVHEKGDFGEKGTFEDEITLAFDDGDELYVPACFLKMASPVFTRMLDSDFREKATRVIELKGKSPGDVLEMLWFLHPATQKRITATTVFRILPLEEDYEIRSVISDGKTVLMNILNEASLPGAKDATDTRPGITTGFSFSAGPPTTVTNRDENVNARHCESLHDCLKVLDMAVTFSYTNIEETALAHISKYPSGMYTKRSEQREIAKCYEMYSTLSEETQIKTLKRRLDVQDIGFSFYYKAE